MQEIFVTRGGHHQKPENIAKVNEILEEQKGAIDQAKRAGIPIVFLEYASIGEDTNKSLKEAAGSYSNVKYIKKNTDGMLDNHNTYRDELVNYLKQHHVGTLVITGANGGACVSASIQGALKNNCTVIAFNKGIADFNFPDFIYPYAGHYTHIKPDCKNCEFREVANLENAAKYMIKKNVISRPPPTSSTIPHDVPGRD